MNRHTQRQQNRCRSSVFIVGIGRCIVLALNQSYIAIRNGECRFAFTAVVCLNINLRNCCFSSQIFRLDSKLFRCRTCIVFIREFNADFCRTCVCVIAVHCTVRCHFLAISLYHKGRLLRFTIVCAICNLNFRCYSFFGHHNCAVCRTCCIICCFAYICRNNCIARTNNCNNACCTVYLNHILIAAGISNIAITRSRSRQREIFIAVSLLDSSIKLDFRNQFINDFQSGIRICNCIVAVAFWAADKNRVLVFFGCRCILNTHCNVINHVIAIKPFNLIIHIHLRFIEDRNSSTHTDCAIQCCNGGFGFSNCPILCILVAANKRVVTAVCFQNRFSRILTCVCCFAASQFFHYNMLRNIYYFCLVRLRIVNRVFRDLPRNCRHINRSRLNGELGFCLTGIVPFHCNSNSCLTSIDIIRIRYIIRIRVKSSITDFYSNHRLLFGTIINNCISANYDTRIYRLGRHRKCITRRRLSIIRGCRRSSGNNYRSCANNCYSTGLRINNSNIRITAAISDLAIALIVLGLYREIFATINHRLFGFIKGNTLRFLFNYIQCASFIANRIVIACGRTSKCD